MGVPEIVQHGFNGFCVEPGDKSSLAASLKTLAQSAELRSELGANSRRLAEERFSFSRRAEAIGRRSLLQAAGTEALFTRN